MCEFASGFFKPDTMEVRVWDLSSHSATQEHYGLHDTDRPDSWREFHYLPNGTIECRIIDGDTHTSRECESAMRARWPRFLDFLTWALASIGDEYPCCLDLNGLTSAKGLTLSKHVGSDLDLSGLTSAKGLTLPERVGGWLDLNGLTSAKGLTLPEHVGGDLYLSGLTSAEEKTALIERFGNKVILS